MSFFKSLKRAFGFTDSDLEDEDDVIGIDATVKPRITPASLANGTAKLPSDDTFEPEADDASPIELPPSVPAKIFETVVEVFNQTMPAFVKAGLDVEAQSDYLYQLIDQATKDYLASLEEKANSRCEARWRASRDKLVAEMNALRDKLHSTEDRTADSKKMQLSAERQKRALSERVHDLEKQVASLEAENEQYDLENKSLVNKLRLASLGADAAAGADLSEADLARIAELEKDNEQLRNSLEQMKMKTEMSDAMINDLNAKASDSATRAAAADEETAALKEKLRLATEELEAAQEELKASKEELQASQEELQESQQSLEAIEEIQAQLETLEQMQQKKDARIKELSDELRHRDDSIHQLEDLNDSLRKTIENNLYAQAESESLMKQELESLRSQLDKKGRHAEPERPKKKDRGPKISAIDESLENTDWLIATPPEGMSTSIRPKDDEPFGYKEPERKRTPDDSAQMSLW